jgi:hypothetical protein
VTAVLVARGHEFRARLAGSTATLEMRARERGQDAESGWQPMGPAGTIEPLPAGRVTNVEIWHADQSLQVWVDGDLAASALYDWTPDERLRNVTGNSVEQIIAIDAAETWPSVLAEPDNYQRPQLRWEFTGAPVTLHRVALDRDLHYQAYGSVPPGEPGGQYPLATHPLRTPTLTRDQFFVCGDNSPASADARLWGPPDPWVAAEIDPTPGVVPRDLLIGRAFFVYFPSLLKGEGTVPVPDFGRLRFIW